jgi:hypothetical protein
MPFDDDDAPVECGQVERVGQTHDPGTDNRIVEEAGTHRVANASRTGRPTPTRPH